jgi:hypothetical protein
MLMSLVSTRMRSLSVGCHRTHEATHMEMAVDLPMSLSTLGDRYFSFGLFHAWFNNSTGYTRRVPQQNGCH